MQANFLSRHYSYECKARPDERPYQARPSRTAQLKNPKLAPKLSSDVPNDLLRKKGTADEILASKATERGPIETQDGVATRNRLLLEEEGGADPVAEIFGLDHKAACIIQRGEASRADHLRQEMDRANTMDL
ncbi:hypothetical protein FKW77_004408 [Venturia effusa]|uniref:Uncharacterized protein n=1 Tax=Venturia effusa TaxID=50376 RepID=A0A517LLI7_9PEZI|nr:hypothetical protein FKW77_004408 [Venturia effusa]